MDADKKRKLILGIISLTLIIGNTLCVAINIYYESYWVIFINVLAIGLLSGSILIDLTSN